MRRFRQSEVKIYITDSCCSVKKHPTHIVRLWLYRTDLHGGSKLSLSHLVGADFACGCPHSFSACGVTCSLDVGGLTANTIHSTKHSKGTAETGLRFTRTECLIVGLVSRSVVCSPGQSLTPSAQRDHINNITKKEKKKKTETKKKKNVSSVRIPPLRNIGKRLPLLSVVAILITKRISKTSFL